MSGVMTLAAFAAMSERSGAPLLRGYPEHEKAHRPFLWYVATPYSHASAAVREQRALMATAAKATLLDAGVHAYSPIAAHHPASLYMTSSKVDDHAFWMRVCFDMLDRCDGLLVVTMDGWRQSKGVQMEIDRWVLAHGNTGRRKVVYASPVCANEPWHPRFSPFSGEVEFDDLAKVEA